MSHFKRVDPPLFTLLLTLSRSHRFEIHEAPDKFVSLCREVIGQQLAGKAAIAIFNRFTTLFPNNHPTPELVAALTEQDIRNVGASFAKARTLKDLSEKVLQKTVDLNLLDSLDNEAVVLELTKVKGIGPWTAEMFLMFSLARTDVFSPGDLGLQKGIQKLYNLSSRPNPKGAIELSRKWSPYRTFASLALWRSLE